MKKSYIFYGAVAAIVAIDFLMGNVGTDTVQMVEMIEVTAEAQPLDEVVTAEDEVVTLLENVLPIVIAVGLVPVILNIFKAFLEP